MATELRIEGLLCIRGGRTVVNALSFTVPAGEVMAITGPNGAGKTSLLRAIAGLLRPAAGSIILTGGDPERTVGEQSHFLGHLDPVKPALTVAENLSFWVDCLGADGGLAPSDALARVGLAELADLPGGYLSAGQRRRLSLARLLAIRRRVWLLDEPTSTLDAAGQSRFGEFVAAHLAERGIVVAATHQPLNVPHAKELRLQPAVLSRCGNAFA